jgi:DNA modification methylase
MSKPKRQPAPDLSYIAEELRQFAVPIASLVLDPANARDHGEANRASVRASLTERGQTLPITVRQANRLIMTGNCTVEEMLALGHTHVAALFRDYTEAQAAAWAIAHNRTAELATWDYRQLGETMAAFPEVDWLAVGHEANELEAILAHAAVVEIPSAPETTTVGEHERELPSDGPDDDEVPPPPSEPRTKFGEVIQLGRHTLHCLDCMDLLRSLPDNSIDAIVTDPPYGLSPDGRARTWDDIEALRREGKGPTSGFMNNTWDAGVPGISWARECLRVLKPGGHMIAHSATRTIHRLACAIEDAGFELRDQIGWLHWQGFPKSHNVSIAIDASLGADRTVERGRRMVPDASVTRPHFAGMAGDSTASTEYIETAPASPEAKRWDGWGTALKPAIEPAVFARKPISEPTVAENVLRWGTGGISIDACRYSPGDLAWPGPGGAVESMPYPKAGNKIYGELGYREGETWDGHDLGRFPANIYYCPKPAGAERELGTEHLPQEEKAQLAGSIASDDPVSARFRSQPTGNAHPTVKPIKLYRWLLRLVTPPGGRVLEPFGGSGTTLVAACDLDCEVIASEMSPKYADIIRARVEARLARAALP